jgi:hypothetical protein
MNDQPTPRNRCATCEWFVPNEKNPAGAGACKRYPPSLMYTPVPIQDLAGDTGITAHILGTAWPNVLPVHFCGEHRSVPHASIIRQ